MNDTGYTITELEKQLDELINDVIPQKIIHNPVALPFIKEIGCEIPVTASHGVERGDKLNTNAIETKYKGFKFRSRLEARWAVFFDALQIRWEYEPEGYTLSSGVYYLPDFYLPFVNSGVWIEVKPMHSSAESVKTASLKLNNLVNTTQTMGMLVTGDPVTNVELAYGSVDVIPYSWNMMWPNDGEDFPYLFCECSKCHKIGITFDGRGGRVDCKCENSDKDYTGNCERINNAALKARQARFEFGETPLPPKWAQK